MTTPQLNTKANKTDAGNRSKAICRVSNVLRSPSPDPRRSAKKMWKQIAILTLGLSLAGCGDGRPDGEVARRQFERLYPEAEVIDVRITENEVVARSIRFRYRDRTTKREGEIEIQFMESEDSDGWIPNPEPPAKLPQLSAEHDSGLNGLQP